MSFRLSILAIDREIFAGEVHAVTLPTSAGQIQVLSEHTPLVAILKEGDMVIEKQDHSSQVFPIAGGVAEVLQEKVVALVNF